MRLSTCILLLALTLSACAPAAGPAPSEPSPDPLRLLTWNIWNGGDEAMKVQDATLKAEKLGRVVDVIQASQADVVAMIETYGSGEAISQALGFHFHPRGTNVSIHSRWPIVKDLSVVDPFHCVGALIRRPDGREFAVFCIWLHYLPDIWTDPASRQGKSAADLIAAEGPVRVQQIGEILKGIQAKCAELPGVPVILAGDFNSNSHLDYTEAARPQFGLVVEWPCTKAVTDAGFRDSYRVCHPVVDRMKDRTWSPMNPANLQDRIDFVFWRGNALQATTSRMIDTHPLRFPSDHAAVLSTFAWKCPLNPNQ